MIPLPHPNSVTRRQRRARHLLGVGLGAALLLGLALILLSSPQADARVVAHVAAQATRQPGPSFQESLPTGASPAFVDTFDDPTSGLLVNSRLTDTELYYGDGQYHVVVNQPRKGAYSDWSGEGQVFADVAIEVEATYQAAGSDFGSGLVVRGNGSKNQYVFIVRQDGTYFIRRRLDGQETTLSGLSTSSFIRPGVATNVLSVIAQGPQLSFFANGHLLDTVTDDTFTVGRVGLYAGTDSTGGNHVVFDNARIWDLGGGIRLTPVPVLPLEEMLPPGARLIFTDTFDNPLSGLPCPTRDPSQNDCDIHYYDTGQYRFDFSARDGGFLAEWPAVYRDFAVEVEVAWPVTTIDNLYAGFLARRQGYEENYAVGINNAGGFELRGHTPAGENVLLSDTSAWINRDGKPNRLGLIAQGPNLTMTINGHPVGQVQDAAVSEGRLALFADASGGIGSQVVFDNVSVWELPPPSAWSQLVNRLDPGGWIALGIAGLVIALWVFRRQIVAWLYRLSGRPTVSTPVGPVPVAPTDTTTTEPPVSTTDTRPVLEPPGLTHNPYIVGPPIDDASLFFGRKDVFDYVRKELESTRGNLALVLYGGRRTGKTSTLLQIRNGRLGPAYAPVYIDMQVMAEVTAHDFFARITQGIADALNDPGLRAAGESLGRKENNPYRAFEQVLDQACRAVGERRLLLMFDEYEILERMVDTGRMSPDIFPYLKSIMEQPRRLALLFTGSRPLEEMRSQFWDWARTFAPAQYKRISFLSDDEARRLIIEPVQAGITYETPVIEMIKRLGAGHPYFTQGICRTVIDLLLYEKRQVVTPPDVDESVTDLVENPLPHMIFLWNEASLNERLVLAALAVALATPDDWLNFEQAHAVLSEHRAQVSAETVHSILATLVRRDELLERRDEAYRYRIDLLRYWIRDEHSLWQTMAEQADAP
jgi:hypothetical protein